MKQYICCILLLLSVVSRAQLSAGFNKPEYLELLQIFSRLEDTTHHRPALPYPEDYRRVYTSPEMGLKNQWQLWRHRSLPLAVICIRGTVGAAESWLENFYAGMVPASGALQLNDSTRFTYKLAADTQAMVHVGWLVGMASMAPDILNKIREAYNRGVRQFIVMGHSQGGGIAFLLTSYIYYAMRAGNLPADLVIKTYCSAAPKPGNLFYAYDFKYITRHGWAFTVVNAADWVPETPVSIQTIHDFSTPNPFTNLASSLSRQPFFIRWYLKTKYRKLNHASEKARKLYSKYLGSLAYRQVKKYLPQFREPAYGTTNNYQRAGRPIVLQPDDAYWNKYPRNSTRVFTHHLLKPYYELALQY